jgi:hypothetical protein
MNERIIEMAIAAGFNPVNCTGGNVPLFEKFAELIIKECIKVLETNNANLTSDAKWDAIYEIETHFGVEK